MSILCIRKRGEWMNKSLIFNFHNKKSTDRRKIQYSSYNIHLEIEGK